MYVLEKRKELGLSFNDIKNRINRLVNFVNQRKVIKEQLRSLTKKHSKANSINDSKEDKYIVLGEEQKNDNQDTTEMLLQEIV